MHSTLLDFAAREGIDIMVLGSKESKGTVQKLVQPGGMGASTSDTVKSKCKCPCLIVRPAVRSLPGHVNLFIRDPGINAPVLAGLQVHSRTDIQKIVVLRCHT